MMVSKAGNVHNPVLHRYGLVIDPETRFAGRCGENRLFSRYSVQNGTVSPSGDSSQRSQGRLEESPMLLRGFAAAEGPALVDEVARIAQAASFRHMVTPGGYTMSVAMTNCGRLGWFPTAPATATPP
jgi:hypothetical protein